MCTGCLIWWSDKFLLPRCRLSAAVLAGKQPFKGNADTRVISAEGALGAGWENKACSQTSCATVVKPMCVMSPHPSAGAALLGWVRTGTPGCRLLRAGNGGCGAGGTGAAHAHSLYSMTIPFTPFTPQHSDMRCSDIDFNLCAAHSFPMSPMSCSVPHPLFLVAYPLCLLPCPSSFSPSLFCSVPCPLSLIPSSLSFTACLLPLCLVQPKAKSSGSSPAAQCLTEVPRAQLLFVSLGHILTSLKTRS